MRTFAALLFLLVATPARADVPPPQGYVETCTAAIQQRAGGHCEDCGSWYGAAGQHTDCPTHYTGTAFTKRCQTYGASAWTEVWCDAPASPTPPAPTPAVVPSAAHAPATGPSASVSPAGAHPPAAGSGGGCSVSRGGDGPIGATSLFALATMAGLARIFRRRAARGAAPLERPSSDAR